MTEPAAKTIEAMTDQELRQEIKALAGNETTFKRRWTMLQELGSRARLGQVHEPTQVRNSDEPSR